MVQGGISDPYQFVGAPSGVARPPELRDPAGGAVSFDQVGQQHGCRIHQPSRGYSLPLTVSAGSVPVGVVSAASNSPRCFPYSRRGQPRGGLPLQGEVPPLRVDAELPGVPADLPVSPPPAGGGPVCLPAQFSAPEVLLSESGPSGVEGGRDVVPVVQSAAVCLPAVLDASQGVGEDRAGRSGGSSRRPSLAAQTVVSLAPVPSGGSSQAAAASEGSGRSTPVGSASSSRRESASLSLAALRQQGKEAGLSDRAAQFAAEAIRVSTRATYDSKLQCYFDWCERNDCDPPSASLGQIGEFLLHLFDKGLAPNSIRLYRSAIAACHGGFEDGSSISSSSPLARMIRSFELKRPRSRPLLPAWSLPAVLQALAKEPFEPMSKASLHHLTLKAAFLVAIASGHRVSTLNALSVDPVHIRWEPQGVRLVPRPDFIAKNQTHSSPLVEVFLPSIASFSSVADDKLWCPVRALRWYLDRVKTKRCASSLFVTHIEPFKAASKSTIARWLVECIRAAGPEALVADRIRAHDTRSISTSWALFHGASLKEIQAAAYWSSPNTFIACYLKDVPRGEAAFASAVLKAASGV